MVNHINTAAEFETEVNRAPGLVVVDFFATWCGPCKQIAPLFEELSNKYKGSVFLKVDVDKGPNRPIVQKFGVRGMPTFVFLKKGQEVAQFSGADPNKLKQLVEQHSTKAGGFHGKGRRIGDEQEAFVKKDPQVLAPRAVGGPKKKNRQRRFNPWAQEGFAEKMLQQAEEDQLLMAENKMRKAEQEKQLAELKRIQMEQEALKGGQDVKPAAGGEAGGQGNNAPAVKKPEPKKKRRGQPLGVNPGQKYEDPDAENFKKIVREARAARAGDGYVPKSKKKDRANLSLAERKKLMKEDRANAEIQKKKAKEMRKRQQIKEYQASQRKREQARLDMMANQKKREKRKQEDKKRALRRKLKEDRERRLKMEADRKKKRAAEKQIKGLPP